MRVMWDEVKVTWGYLRIGGLPIGVLVRVMWRSSKSHVV